MTEEDSDNPPLLGDVMDARGVAQYLGFSTATIYNKVRDNDMPYIRLGNTLRFPKAEIDQWLSRNTVRPQDSFYDYFIQMSGRFFFSRWLESRGLQAATADSEEVRRQALLSLEDLKAKSEQDDFYVES